MKNITGSFFVAALFLMFSSALHAQPVYEWAKSIGSYLGFHQVTGICNDSKNNVYITGFCGNDVDFDPGPGISPPGLGQVNTFIAKFDPLGNYLWVQTIANQAQGSSIAVDFNSNVYVTSSFYLPSIDFHVPGGIKTIYNAEGYNNILIAKYDSSGNCMWAKGIGGSMDDFGKSIAVDKFANVYITGGFTDTVNFDPDNDPKNLISKDKENFFLAKYDSDGNYVWAKGAIGNGWSLGGQVVVDKDSNPYVAGIFQGTSVFSTAEGIGTISSVDTEYASIFFTKYDSHGNCKWVKTAGLYVSNIYGDNTIALDSLEFIYIDGQYKNTTDLDPGSGTVFLPGFGSFFAKYDNNGNYVWAKTIGFTNVQRLISFEPLENSLATDKMNNLYITGSFRDTNNFAYGIKDVTLKAHGQMDAFLAKYDPNANYLWVEGFGSDSVHASNFGHSISLDNSDNIFLTGSFFGTTDFDPGQNVVNLPTNGWYDKQADMFFAKYSQVKSSVQSISSQTSEVTVFPNPSSGLIHLQGTLPMPAKLEAKVFNILGAEVYHNTYDAPSEFSLQMDVCKLSAGMYTVELTSADFRKQIQFVKE